MRNKCVAAAAIALIFFSTVSTGCAGPPVQEPPLSPSDNASIYAAVVRQLATKDDTFGGTLQPQIIFIIRRTNNSAGNPASNYSSSTVVIPSAVQTEITTLLQDLPGTVVWVDKFDDAVITPGNVTQPQLPVVKDKGVIITLGNISRRDDSSVQIAGSIYIASLAAGGSTYVLKKQSGVWVITGTTGPRWIS